MTVPEVMSVTFSQAHQRLLRELEQAWTDLRAVHASPDFLNDAAREYADAKAAFKEAQEAIWRLKNAYGPLL